MDNLTLKEGFVGQKMIVLPNDIKKRLKENHVTSAFYITDIGFYPMASHHHRTRKKGAKEYIFIYCTEGEGTLKVRSEIKKIKPNNFFIVPKKTPHEYWANEQNPWSIYWIHFDGSSSKHIFKRYSQFMHESSIIPFENDRIKTFNQIFNIFLSDYVEPRLEYANVLGLNFISSFVYYKVERSFELDTKNILVEKIIEFLNQNLHRSIKSEEIAKEFNRSPSHIFNLFKKKTGYSLIHFFNLKKMQKACEYINYTDFTAKEISYRVGFQDPLYFSRMFKKYMGVSPRLYKKEQKN
ncbi:AraC family transcriptional regulator [Spongiivirga citrea]|uniref:Helix-turn-helix domain-containing protein n=1 Tax=Spongiivirga citrea TaxID=1481457 RepID=A0A6M0CJS2_9FLAO|nr:AraC family transcriptional regulator [Spongiivirga citrea]NER17872.1 helix-turn-helix domain-containing protein [Spongiivirga citrea]